MAEKIKSLRGWKMFEADLSCREFKFEVGKTYEINGDISLCERGFHFHHNFDDRFSFYSGKDRRCCEVFAENVIVGNDKAICSKITIVRELTWREIKADGYGDGYGYGDGDGDGDGDGYGDSYGYGYGYLVPEMAYAD